MLAVRGLAKRFTTAHGTVQAVNDVSFEVQQGEFYTLLGPSGCGKTTTLQCVAGLESPDGGEIEIAGTVAFSSGRRVDLPTHARDIGIVFQSYAIWPHMTVYENVAYPLLHGRRPVGRRAARERVMEALRLVHLDALADRPSPFLSGGQQQRVAVARALVDEPQVLLLDEPLSNLDAKLREEMRVELRQLVKRLNITTLYVTHDQVEALSMSDRVAVMANGEIVQEGTPREVYAHPRQAFVANFVGRINFLDGRVLAGGGAGVLATLATSVGELRCAAPDALEDGTRALVAVRPETIRVSTARPDGAARVNVVEGTIRAVGYFGDHVDCQVDVNGQVLSVKADAYAELRVGDRAYLELPPERIMLWPGESGGLEGRAAEAASDRPTPAPLYAIAEPGGTSL
jgi:iron(III) transport system ATP-binding protein